MRRNITATPRRPLGDPAPAALAAYYVAIDDRRFEDAAAAFAPTGLYALAPMGAEETAPRRVSVGPAALRRRLRDRGPQPWRHEIRLCVVEGADALLEGVLVTASGLPIATFVASARVGDHGLLDRYLAFSCPSVVDPIPAEVDPTHGTADAAAVVQGYFAALDAGRFADAARHFSSDVLYSHPPYKHTGITAPGRVEFRGRPALQAAFIERGRTSFDHTVLTSIQRGPHCLFEGAVNHLPNGRSGSFISSLSLAADGTIRRYVSFYCEPAVNQ
jgi:ketosteroid isomerase-like protein